MGAVAGAVLGAPFRAIPILFEMTASYSMALVVMLATVISAILVNDRAADRLFQLAAQAAGHRPKGSHSANRSR